MLRRVLYLLAVVTLVACANAKRMASIGQIAIRSVEIGSEQSKEVVQGEIPEELSLLIGVENPGAGLKIISGDLYVYYKGRKVAILSLKEGVRVAGRCNSVVELCLSLHMAHNSHSRALVESLRRHSVEGVALGWGLKMRRGLVAGLLEQEAVALSEIVGEQELERLWQMMPSAE